MNENVNKGQVEEEKSGLEEQQQGLEEKKDEVINKDLQADENRVNQAWSKKDINKLNLNEPDLPQSGKSASGANSSPSMD